MHKFFIRLGKSLTSRIRGLSYLIYNLWASRSFKPIPLLQLGDYTIAGLKPALLPELDRLHCSLRNGRPLSKWRRTLLRYKGSVFCGVVADQNGKLVGFQLRQLIRRDFKRGIVHIEFTGLLPEARGRGLAGALRMYIISYYLANGFKGVSANIRADNLAAIKSAEKLGFQIIDRHCNGHLIKIYWDLEELKQYL